MRWILLFAVSGCCAQRVETIRVSPPKPNLAAVDWLDAIVLNLEEQIKALEAEESN